MALTECPDCYERVSRRAPACPKCGCPIAGGRPRPAAVSVTSVQFTHKWIKVVWALSLMLVVAGFAPGLFVRPEEWTDVTRLFVAASLGAGFPGLLVAGVARWWHHA